MKFKHSVLYESLVAVMPITLLIIVINFLLPQRMQTFDFINFIVGNVFLIGGMTLYSKGTKISLAPVGDAFGTYMIKKKRILLLIFMGIFLGFVITVAEPDLSVLGEQLGSIKWTLISFLLPTLIGVILCVCVKWLFQIISLIV